MMSYEKKLERFNQQNFKPLELKITINFLVKKFTEINIITQSDDWYHIRDYKINSCQDKWERKFLHKELGYIEIKENNKHLEYSPNLVDIFRHVTKSGNLELTKQLFSCILEKYKNPNIGYHEDLEYNLTNAVRHGHLNIVQYLVAQNVSIHVDGETNVIVAATHKHYDVMQFLLENDSNINQEFIFKSCNVSDEAKVFIRKWNLNQKLSQEISIKITTKNKVKI